MFAGIGGVCEYCYGELSWKLEVSHYSALCRVQDRCQGAVVCWHDMGWTVGTAAGSHKRGKAKVWSTNSIINTMDTIQHNNNILPYLQSRQTSFSKCQILKTIFTSRRDGSGETAQRQAPFSSHLLCLAPFTLIVILISDKILKFNRRKSSF